MLRCFEVVFGVHLNPTKSSLIAAGEVPNFDQLAVLGYWRGHLPSTYLGLPLGALYKKKEVWGPVEWLEVSLLIKRGQTYSL